MLNLNVIWSVLRRNVQGYFSGVLGYLVIVLFVTIAAFCAFSPKFFANNLANLDQLSAVFPVLLLVMVPAITMSTWAEERKLGTDEILFTLPASDMEILLGKYLAALAVYSIALAFSLTQLFVLAWIGNPDWGVVFTTYVGYWLAGAALISAGMFASVLTGSTTVAYVLGATLCAIPVFIGSAAPGNTLIQSLSLSSQLRDFSVGMIPVTSVLYFIGLTVFMLYLNMVFITRRHWARSESTAMGAQFALRGVFLAVALVSVNYMAEKSTGYVVSRVDMTGEGLYTLSPTTKEVIAKAKEDERSITVQAFISPEVPQKYVHARKRLVGLLQQYDRIGGNTVDVRFVDVKPNSKAAKEARTLGIKPVRDQSEVGGKTIEQDVFLGVFVSSIREEPIEFLDGETSMEYELTRSIANVSTRPERLKVGILETDGLRLNEPPPGAPSIRRFYGNILDQLESQYDVVEVTRAQLAELVADDEEADKKEDDSAKDESDKDESSGDDEKGDDEAEEDDSGDKPDVLIVVQPSSLTRAAMGNLIKYIQQGNPVILSDDPVPFFPFTWYPYERMPLGLINAPKQDRPSPDSGLSWVTNVERLPIRPDLQQQIMQMQQQFGRMGPQVLQQMMADFYRRNPEARAKFEPKADNGTASSLMKAIGLDWDNGSVVFDSNEPHPNFSPEWDRNFLGADWPTRWGALRNTFLFVTPDNGAETAFNPDDPIAAGLNELLFIYPGSVRKRTGSKFNYEPLVTTGPNSGIIPWEELTFSEMTPPGDRNHLTPQEDDNNPKPMQSPYTMGTYLRLNPRPNQSFDKDTHVLAAHVSSESKDDTPGINVVFIADTDFMSDYYFRQAAALEKPADNATFLINAIEVLAGDESLISLRNRKSAPRRLTAIQGEIDKFRLDRTKAQQEAETKINEQLKLAKAEWEKTRKEITDDKPFGFEMVKNLQEQGSNVERDFEIEKEQLEEELRLTIDDLKATENDKTNKLETRVRVAAVLLPPLPALFLGLCVLIIRGVNERSRVVDTRRHA
jgi:ABC-2 type transport system permease protein